MAYYDRYLVLKRAKVDVLPSVTLELNDTDYSDVYTLGKTRFDRLSNQYYGNPTYGWLILLANQNLGLTEFEIEDKAELRIPFPLETAIADYERKMKKLLNI